MVYEFSAEDKKKILLLCRRSVLEFFDCIEERGLSSMGAKELDEYVFGFIDKIDKNYLAFSHMNDKIACFVALKVFSGGVENLRGNMGNVLAEEKFLYSLVKNSVCAAFFDSSFPPLAYEELAGIVFEVSLIVDLESIGFSSDSELFSKISGKGVLMSRGPLAGTFLPSVWGRLSDPERFLNELCKVAGLLPEDWRKCEFAVYDAVVFKEDASI